MKKNSSTGTKSLFQEQTGKVKPKSTVICLDGTGREIPAVGAGAVAEPSVKATFRAVRDSLAFSRYQTSLADLQPHPLLPLSDGCTLKRKHLDSPPEVVITEQSFNHVGKDTCR
jgi:hypothetical protein